MYKPSHLRKVVHYLPIFQTPWMNSKRQLNPSYLDLKAKGLLLFLHQDHCFPERKNQNRVYSVNMSKKRLLHRDSLSKVPFWTVLSQSVTLTDGQCLQEHGWWKTQRKRMILLFWRICLCGVMGNVWKRTKIKKRLWVWHLNSSFSNYVFSVLSVSYCYTVCFYSSQYQRPQGMNDCHIGAFWTGDDFCWDNSSCLVNWAILGFKRVHYEYHDKNPMFLKALIHH